VRLKGERKDKREGQITVARVANSQTRNIDRERWLAAPRHFNPGVEHGRAPARVAHLADANTHPCTRCRASSAKRRKKISSPITLLAQKKNCGRDLPFKGRNVDGAATRASCRGVGKIAATRCELHAPFVLAQPPRRDRQA